MGPSRLASGYVLITGPANTGKSSLFNALTGSTLSPVHHRPNTTRFPITGISCMDGAQACFIDSQPLENPVDDNWFSSCDVVILVVDARRFARDLETEQVRELFGVCRGMPVVVALGFGDHLPGDLRVPVALQAGYDLNAAGVVTVCPPLGMGIPGLRTLVAGLLPVREQLFPDGVPTLNSSRFLAAERIRVNLMSVLPEEVADTTAVQIEEYTRKNRKLYIRVNLLVSRHSDKGTVIGRKGQTLARIQKDSETLLEKLSGVQVQVEPWVKVREGWPDKPSDLMEFGLGR